jgi:hypothetical protein
LVGARREKERARQQVNQKKNCFNRVMGLGRLKIAVDCPAPDEKTRLQVPS